MELFLIPFLYALLVFAATFFGAITGNGGGIVIKPIMDMVGTFSVSQIAIFTSCTVFAMSFFSLLRQTKTRKQGLYPKKVNTISLLLLIIGGVLGGLMGEYVFSLLVKGTNEALVKLIQSCLFILMLGFGYFYMLQKDKLGLRFTNPLLYFSVAFFLGIISSFLGIGGGTLNTAFLMLLFSLSIKEAVFCSLSIVMPAQGAKLIFMAINGKFALVSDTTAYITLVAMVIAGIVGGLIGSAVASKCKEKTVVNCFYILQTVILAVTVVNIVRFGMALN